MTKTRFALTTLAALALTTSAAFAEIKAKIGHAMPETHPQAQAELKQAGEVVTDLKARGMSVNEMPPAELDKIRVAVQPVVDKNAEAIGSEFVQAFYGELKKFRAAKR